MDVGRNQVPYLTRAGEASLVVDAGVLAGAVAVVGQALVLVDAPVVVGVVARWTLTYRSCFKASNCFALQVLNSNELFSCLLDEVYITSLRNWSLRCPRCIFNML